MSGMDMNMPIGSMQMPGAPATAPSEQGSMASMPGIEMREGAMPEMPGSGMQMPGALGPYPMEREASGTTWQPDASVHDGQHYMHGNWMFMAHGLFNAVYDWQSGPRGRDKAFVSGMAMGVARYTASDSDMVNLRAMLSPDAFMGKSGYPLLFATGETANGIAPLVDRQHPHDLFMELSASYAHKLTPTDSVFVYAGLPGEPAFGPPAFMHRLSAMDSPEAPITHHWLDSTHITFGVVTAGWVHDDWKLEASGFRGREPDQNRFDIESPKLDSASVRVSWNPTRRLSLQGSWAQVHSPEQLEPDTDQRRWSASAIYTLPLAHGWWSTTAAFGRKELSNEPGLNGWLLESAVHPNVAWTVWARGEWIETNELGSPHTAVRNASKASVGVIRDFRVWKHALFGIGAFYSQDWAPDALSSAYGEAPRGAMIFARLKLG
jgi:hypothetical protein